MVSLLLSPLGWVYYYWLALGPALAVFLERRSWLVLLSVLALCVPAPPLLASNMAAVPPVCSAKAEPFAVPDEELVEPVDLDALVEMLDAVPEFEPVEELALGGGAGGATGAKV